MKGTSIVRPLNSADGDWFGPLVIAYWMFKFFMWVFGWDDDIIYG